MDQKALPAGRQEFGMYGDDVETHLAAKPMDWVKHEIQKFKLTVGIHRFIP